MARTEVTGSQIKDASVSLTADVTGTLPVANGGTGSTTLALNNVLLGNGTGAFQAVAPSTSGNILTSNGTTWSSTAFPNSPKITQVSGSSGEAICSFASTGSTSLNYVEIQNSATANAVFNTRNSASSNVGITLLLKGSGQLYFYNPAGIEGTIFSGGPDDSHNMNLKTTGSGVIKISNNANGDAAGTLQTGTIDLGGTDTTLARSSAGMVSVEGNPLGLKVSVPASASSSGQPGQWAADSSYIYVYTGNGSTHTWVRASAGSW